MTDAELPTKADFDPWNGGLDALSAYRIFGGLSIPQAIQKFQEDPDNYQEAFMFMGGKAFAYYFPVIENHLYSVPNLDSNDDDWQDPCAWILAHCIKMQFEYRDNQSVQHLAGRVIDLADFVHDNINRFGTDQPVAEAWEELVQTIKRCRTL